MKMYLPFGDWSNDGHGRYEKILIDAPSMEHLHKAQEAIMEKRGKYFFEGMADEYDDPTFASWVWEELINTNYPIERLVEKEDNNEWDKYDSLYEALQVDSNPYVGLNFVIDAFIWLLNAYGAEITIVDKDIPMICNWTCHGFKTVGYGCFYG